MHSACVHLPATKDIKSNLWNMSTYPLFDPPVPDPLTLFSSLLFSPIPLPQPGLSSLFENPNLCGLYAEDKIVLDDARHRAFLALTEQGVEAGAATTLSFSRSFPSFSALRPFIMLLWSDQANVPLFIGRVTDPWERGEERQTGTERGSK